MSERLLLGIDVGSSSVKAATFDCAGRQVECVRVACESRGEFPPERWWDATVEAVERLDCGQVAAAGVCGRGGTNVLLDATGAIVAPSWSDRRAHAEFREMSSRHPDLGRAALNLLAKAAWWEHHQGRIATAITAKDLVVLRLTSVLVADPASGGATTGKLPPLVEVREPWAKAGTVTARAAAVTRLTEGIPVAAGWHDGAAAAFGAGAAIPGTAAMTLGTNAVYRVVTDRIPDGLPHYWDLTPGVTVTGGDIVAAGTAMAWARAVVAGATMERSEPGARGLTFLPQFAGRIAPDVNGAARGVFYGLDGSQTADDLLRAAGEGIAFSLRQVRDHLVRHGAVASRSIATGAGAHDPVQAQIVADVLQQPVQVAECEEGCRGAALLGGVAAGFVDLEEARTMMPAGRCFEPDTASAEAYDAGYRRFLSVQAAADQVQP